MDNPADHAQDFAERYERNLDLYCAERMQWLGIPDHLIGANDPYTRRPWQAFVASERKGGSISTGICVDSGVLNPELLKGRKGGKAWASARLRDRIDAVICHELAEHLHDTHEAALKMAPKLGLPVTDGAMRILKGMAR